MTKSVLIVAAHPDDDILGCGGAIAHHSALGDMVYVLFLADGEGARGDLSQLEMRRGNARGALKLLGVAEENIKFCDFPDNQMDTVPLLEIVKEVENIAGFIKPEIVYTHHHGDLNMDHVLTQKAVLTAFRPMPSQSVKEIYGFEVLSSTGWGEMSDHNAFNPSLFLDVHPYWDKKMAALKFYDSEMREFPHARSYKTAEALAVFRGSMVGLEKAEAFNVIRKII